MRCRKIRPLIRPAVDLSPRDCSQVFKNVEVDRVGHDVDAAIGEAELRHARMKAAEKQIVQQQFERSAGGGITIADIVPNLGNAGVWWIDDVLRSLGANASRRQPSPDGAAYRIPEHIGSFAHRQRFGRAVSDLLDAGRGQAEAFVFRDEKAVRK